MRKIFKLIKILIIIFVILIIIVTLCDEEETTSVDTTGMDMTAEKNTGIQGEKTDIAVEQDPSKVQDIYGAIDDYLNNNKDSGALKKIKTGDKESVWKYLTEKNHG